MADEPKQPTLSQDTVSGLALDTGITEDEVRAIVRLVGTDRSSIRREARVLRNQRLPTHLR